MRFRLRFIALMITVFSLQGACLAVDSKRLLIEHCEPAYPEIARQMHVGGTIILRVSILPDGHISEVNLESGHPLLVEAAEQAVRRWKYAPSTETTLAVVRINFHPSL